MKQIVPLIILILYSILSARRKAMREQKRKEQAILAARGTAMPVDDAPVEQNRQEVERQSVAMEASDRWKNMTEEADRFVEQDDPEVQQAIQQAYDALRRGKQETVTSVASFEDVIPAPVVVAAPKVVDAYEQVTVARRRISFDKQSLRTFFVTREVLGPPRSRKPFQLGIKAHE